MPRFFLLMLLNATLCVAGCRTACECRATHTRTAIECEVVLNAASYDGEVEASWFADFEQNAINFTRVGSDLNGFGIVRIERYEFEEGTLTCELTHEWGEPDSRPMSTPALIRGRLQTDGLRIKKVVIRLAKKHWNRELMEYDFVEADELILDFPTKEEFFGAGE